MLARVSSVGFFAASAVIVLTGSLLTTPAHAAVATSTTIKQVTPQAGDEISRAREFRQATGLDASDGAIAAAQLATHAASQRYGVPLTPAEVARLDNRTKVQEATGEIRQVLYDDKAHYAGAWTDVKTDKFHVAVQRGTPSAEIDALVKNAGINSANVVVTAVDRSTADLEAAKRTFMAGPAIDLAKRGIVVTAIGPDFPANNVAVGIANPSDTAPAELAQQYPGFTFYSQAPMKSVDTRANSGGQWKGGTKIISYDAGEGCSAAFAVTNASGNKFMLTAGHCGLVDTHWDHNWQSQFRMAGSYFLDGSYADVGVIDVTEHSGSNSIVLTEADNGSPFGGQGASVVAARLWSAVGDSVCKAAGVSGYTCGVVSRTDVDATFSNESHGVTISRYLLEQAFVNFASWRGDSGSPIVTPGTNANGVANVSAVGVVISGCGDYGTPCSTQAGFSELGNVYAMTQFNFGQLSVVTQPTGVLLQAGHSGKCLDVLNASTSDGAAIQQWTCNGLSAQQVFRIIPRYGTYQIQNVNSGKCLDVTGAGTANGVRLQQYTCSTVLQQRFHLAKTTIDNGAWPDFQLLAQHSGRCIDVVNVSTANGAAIQQWDCVAGGGGVGNQRWKDA